MANTPFDEEAHRRAMRDRLSDKARMPAFEGKFAKALIDSLASSFSHLNLGNSVEAKTAAEYFTSPAINDISGLLIAVERACQAAQPLSADSADWASELAIYATLRSLNHQEWALLAQAPENGAVPFPASATADLAAKAWCGYKQLLLKVHLQAAPTKQRGLDLTQGLLTDLYDKLESHHFSPRAFKDDQLTPEELGALQTYFQDDRHDLRRRRTLVSVQLEGDTNQRNAAVVALAKTLDAPVLMPSGDVQTEPLNPSLRITPESLQHRLKRLFAQLPTYVQRAQDHHSRQSSASALAAQAEPTGKPPQQPAAQQGATAYGQTQPAFNYDLFISHASEDKARFVDSLVATLQAAGLKVWYDKEQLLPGDSLVKGINKGLAQSRYAVLVLSPRYFAKNWAQAEGRAVYSLQFSDGRMRLIPICLDISHGEAAKQWPLLADLLSIDAAKHTVLNIASQIEAVLTRPPQD